MKKSRNPQSISLTGTRRPTAIVVPGMLLALFMSPLLFIGGTLISYAFDKNGNPAPFGAALLVPIVAGTAFIGLWFYIIWRTCIWLPGITVARFELKDNLLNFHTTAFGELKLTLDDVLKCKRQSGKRGYMGCWILVRLNGWVFLERDNAKADELADYLVDHVDSQP